MGISHVPPVLGGAAGALGGRARPREKAEAVDGTGGVPACRRTRRCRPQRWIHGIVPWIGAHRLRRTATHVKMRDELDAGRVMCVLFFLASVRGASLTAAPGPVRVPDPPRLPRSVAAYLGALVNPSRTAKTIWRI